MRPSSSFVALVLGLSGCAAPVASSAPAPEPPQGAYVHLRLDEEVTPPPSEVRRALEAEWPPVGPFRAPLAPERRRRTVRPRVRWVTTADGAVVEVAAALAPLRPCPIPIRVVRLPDPPAFLLEPPE